MANNLFSPEWARYTSSARKAKGLTRRQVARAAKVDASYVTLMERDGYIPKREKVERIGLVLSSTDEALMAAGMLPKPLEKETAKNQRWASLMERLPADAVHTLELLSRVSRARQNEGLRVLAAYASVELHACEGCGDDSRVCGCDWGHARRRMGQDDDGTFWAEQRL